MQAHSRYSNVTKRWKFLAHMRIWSGYPRLADRSLALVLSHMRQVRTKCKPNPTKKKRSKIYNFLALASVYCIFGVDTYLRVHLHSRHQSLSAWLRQTSAIYAQKGRALKSRMGVFAHAFAFACVSVNQAQNCLFLSVLIHSNTIVNLSRIFQSFGNFQWR